VIRRSLERERGFRHVGVLGCKLCQRQNIGASALVVRSGERPGDEKRLAALALHDGATTIVACGGDGTWSNAANAILSSGSNCRLALLAAGTGNDFAKTVGAPARDLAATARLAVEGPEMLVDVGRIEDRYFLNVTGFGFDIAVLDDLENIPFLTGDLLYLTAALRQLFKFDGMSVDITTAAVARGARAHLMLIVANGRNFGGMFQIAPDARINDGLLDAIAILDAPPLTRDREVFLRLVGWLLTALALSLGAPFWFDLLNRFVNIRGSTRKDGDGKSV